MKLKQISVFLPNEPRQLANFFEFLMENKIYLRISYGKQNIHQIYNCC